VLLIPVRTAGKGASDRADSFF